MKRLISIFTIVVLTISILSGCDIFDSDSSRSDNSNRNSKKCTLCTGTGKSECSWCTGKGYMKVSDIQYPCNSCGGSGIADCLGCNGTGYKDGGSNSNSSNVYIPSFENDSNWESTCRTCNGAGKVTCSSCHGSGSLGSTQYAPDFGFGGGSYQVGQRCYACSGSGMVMCTSCMGDGYN